jgi:beta-lysine N6-acetyltransferase
MTDQVVSFGDSTIQHGKHSDRVYLMQLGGGDLPEVLPYLDHLALTEGYTKIFAKVPATASRAFEQEGFAAEAVVPGLYRGEEDACFMGKYFCEQRRREQRPELVEQALETALEKEALEPPALPQPLCCRQAAPEDAPAMAELYRRVFASYPFPIHDPDYLCQTMADQVIYQGIWEEERLLALASAETDPSGRNAEMTDFATDPGHRGQGLANHLLASLEAAAAKSGLLTAYTIARAYSFGMNITFAKNGYQFSGTLTHNTQIAGSLESMNVWHKPLCGAVA